MALEDYMLGEKIGSQSNSLALSSVSMQTQCCAGAGPRRASPGFGKALRRLSVGLDSEGLRDRQRAPLSRFATVLEYEALDRTGSATKGRTCKACRERRGRSTPSAMKRVQKCDVPDRAL